MKIIGARQDCFGSAHYRGVGPIMAMAHAKLDSTWTQNVPVGTTHVLTGSANTAEYLNSLLEARNKLKFKLVVDYDEHAGPLSDLPACATEDSSDYYDKGQRGGLRLRHLKEADAVIFATETLATANPVDKPSIVLPLFVPQHIPPLLGERIGGGYKPCLYLNIGEWRQLDMAPLADIILSVADKVDLVVSGTRPSWLASLNGQLTHLSHMFFDDYWPTVNRFAPEIVLSPLSGCLYNRCKGETRYIEATLFGAVGLYQDMEPYKNVVNGETGFICSSHESWEERINELIASKSLRRKMLAEARRDLKNRLDFKKAGEEWAKFVKSL